MGGLNFMGGCLSAMALCVGVAEQRNKAFLAIGVAIGAGVIYESIGDFLKDHASAYVVAIGCGMVLRLIEKTWTEEKQQLQVEKIQLQKENRQLQADIESEKERHFFMLMRLAAESQEQNGCGKRSANKTMNQTQQPSVLRGISPYRAQEKREVEYQ